MLISRLHLLAYGHFTNYSLDFGSEPGLHLIYGDNESGKSTTLRALSSVLFGYPHEVVDGFKHDSKDISIGIDLIARDGRRLSFVRRRRGKNALVSADGSALDESVVASFAGGVSRETFEKVFALDHYRLREHALSLLSEGGSLGFSLAEAGSGVAGLKAVLDRLRDDRSALFLAGGAKPKLNQLIARLIELRKEARRRTVSPSEYKKCENKIETIENDLKSARDQQKAIEADVRRLERIARNLPLRIEHQVLSRTIEAFEKIRMLPPEITQQRVKAQADRDAADEDLNRANVSIEALQVQIAGIMLDKLILEHREEIARLAEQRPVIENIEKDIPKRQAELDQHYSAGRDLLSSAELTGDPTNLSGVLPSALKRKAISKLADVGTTLIAKKTAAAENVELATDNLQKAEQQAAQAPKPQDAGHVPRVLAAADRLGDITAEILKRTRALERKTKSLKETIVGLGVKSGDASALRELVVPPEKTVARNNELLAVVDKEIEAHRDVIDRLNNEIADLGEKITALKAVGDVATEDDLIAARHARDERWAIVRDLYIDRRSELAGQAKAFARDEQVADTYEKCVNAADHVADIIRAHVKEATKLSLLRRQEAETQAAKTKAEARAAILRIRRDTLLNEWQTLWPAKLVTSQLPGEMIEWLTRRKAALVEAGGLEEERDEIGNLVRKERDALEALINAINSYATVTYGDGLDRLRDRARQIIEEITSANTEHAKANEAVRTQRIHKNQAEQAMKDVEVQIGEWTNRWRAALEVAGLRPNLSLEAVTVILEIMNNLDILKTKIDDLARRIAAMKEDREGFRKAIVAIASWDPEARASDPVDICRRLEVRLVGAQNAETELKSLSEQLKIQTTARSRAEDKLRRAKAVLEDLCIQAGCANAQDLVEIERKSAEKQQALLVRGKLDTRMREDGGGLDLNALLQECENAVGDRIPGEIALLKTDGAEIEIRVEQLMSNRATLNAEFDGLLAQSQAADSTQAAANVEAEIADIAEAYVDLTVQETLLREAIDLYRDRNQGPILTRAKDLFAELTGGAYSGLRADIDESAEPILIAEDRTRGSLDIPALSDGTVDPLYLALRLAVVQEHNATREPLPFIVDDLLLHLDNTRAQAALRTLAKVAESSQVLFFTHHAHMIELARSSVSRKSLVEHRLLEAVETTRAAE